VKRLLIATVAVLATLLVVVLAAPLLVPADFVKGRLAAVVMQKTGRELRLAGPISVSLLPRLTLTAQDVTLASPSGGFSTEFLTIPTAEVSLKPLALLRGEIEIDQLTLSHPTISFEVDKDGRRNWIFPRPARAPPAAMPSLNGDQSFASGNLAIVDGAAGYLDQRGGKRRSATGVALSVALPRAAGPLSATGTAIYNGENIRLALSVESLDALRDGRHSAVTLDIASPRGNFGFRGDVVGSGAVKASGALPLSLPSLRDFLAWTQIASGGSAGPVWIDGEAEFGGPKLTLSHAIIALDGSTARGALTVERGGARPIISGRLDIDRLDLDAGRKERQTVAPADASPTSSGPASPPAASPPLIPAPSVPPWSDAVIDLASLKLADADLNLTAGTCACATSMWEEASSPCTSPTAGSISTSPGWRSTAARAPARSSSTAALRYRRSAPGSLSSASRSNTSPSTSPASAS
jgi:AsmA protein